MNHGVRTHLQIKQESAATADAQHVVVFIDSEGRDDLRRGGGEEGEGPQANGVVGLVQLVHLPQLHLIANTPFWRGYRVGQAQILQDPVVVRICRQGGAIAVRHFPRMSNLRFRTVINIRADSQQNVRRFVLEMRLREFDRTK